MTMKYRSQRPTFISGSDTGSNDSLFNRMIFFFFFGFGFYGSFKIISLISSRSLIKGGRKPEYPEKNHLTYRCRTWHLTCDPSRARTHSGERSNV